MSADRKQNRTDNGTDRLSEIRARLNAANESVVHSWERWPSVDDFVESYDNEIVTTEQRLLAAHAPADIAWLLDELQQSYWDVDEAIRKGEDAADYWKQQFDSLRRQHKEMRP